MPSYDRSQFTPPAPTALVTLHDPATGRTYPDVLMLLDSGADATVLPQSAVNALGVAADSDLGYEVEGFDESISIASVVTLEMIFLDKSFHGQFLVNDQEYGFIGRNVLNSLPLLFDGPRLSWDEYRP